MLFKYKVVDEKGVSKEGEIDAPSRDMAIAGLQHRGFIVVSVDEGGKKKSILDFNITKKKVPMKDVVMLSRQISTLFEAQVSALKAFSMLGGNVENKLLGEKLNAVCDDLQAGVSISGALAKHPDVFTDFYVNMVKAGEETGKLNKTFAYLADYLDRQYSLTTKTRNALIYPAFVIFTFFVVMGLMFTVVIPKIAAIIIDSGTAIPVFTKVIIGISDIFVHYGFFFLIFFVLVGVWIWRLSSTESGKDYIDRKRINLPGIGNLYRKLFLSRIADNMNTMLSSGIPIIRALDITSKVVGSHIYQGILKDVADDVKSGFSLSSSFEKHPEMPPIMVQMVKVGEETGSMGAILKTLADFYSREVDHAIDTVIGMIEPIMIVVLGAGVGILLVSVLVPIYGMVGSIS